MGGRRTVLWAGKKLKITPKARENKTENQTRRIASRVEFVARGNYCAFFLTFRAV
jgi:hypothetical protein